jgi:hypothetical protein
MPGSTPASARWSSDDHARRLRARDVSRARIPRDRTEAMIAVIAMVVMSTLIGTIWTVVRDPS